MFDDNDFSNGNRGLVDMSSTEAGGASHHDKGVVGGHSNKVVLLVGGIATAFAAVILIFVISVVRGNVNKSSASDPAGVNITVAPGDKEDTATATDKPVATANTADKASGKIEKATTSNSGSSTVADVVSNVMPSIVAVSCKTVANTTDMFGRSYSQEAEGSGSGIIIGQNSSETQILIATNNHVVADAKSVTVTFNDNKQVAATIKGTDSSADLAVIAVNIADMEAGTKESIRIATIGDSASCKVGQTAIAIGNALGYGQSVTVGIVSALEREVSVEDSTMKLIQTDAAINPGNSGGALINSKGELIGINSVKYVSEDTEGIGYAIPITSAVPIINELMNYEEIPDEEKAYLGIRGQDISSEYAQMYSVPAGVAVQVVSEGSPAEKAGITKGCIIVKFAGRDITSMQQIQDALSKKRGGETVELVIKQYSKGEYVDKKVSVKLGRRGDYTN